MKCTVEEWVGTSDAAKLTKRWNSILLVWDERRCQNWVLSCDVCTSDKTRYKRSKAPLGSLGVVATLATLSTNMVGPFPVTPRNNRYNFSSNWHFTNWAEIFAVPDQTATTTTNVIIQIWFATVIVILARTTKVRYFKSSANWWR